MCEATGTSSPPRCDPMSAMRVVVVGAGITGCSTAYQLAARGLRDVTVIDKGHVAGGPTGLSSGIVRQFYTHPVLIQMAQQGRDTYAAFVDRVGGSAGFVPVGWLLAVSDANRAVAAQGLRLQADVGVESRWVSAAEVADLVPGVDIDGLVGGVFEPTAGYADPPGAAQAYLTAARALGVSYRPRTAVTALRHTASRVTGVDTSAGRLDADAVVLAAGPWTAALVEPLGHLLPISASRHGIVSVRETARPRRPVFSDPVNLVYTRPESADLTLVGSNDPSDALDLVDPDRCPPAAAADKVERMLAGASARLPALADGRINATWSGVYDVSDDGFPLLGPLPGVDGVVVATGMSGHGFKLAPAIGEILTRAVLDTRPDPRMHLFRPDRFRTGDLVPSITTSSLTTMRHTR